MGLPISKNPHEDIFRARLRGTPLDHATLTELGLDLTFFEEKFAAFRPHLKYISEQMNLEDMLGSGNPPKAEQWKRLVEEAGLTGTKCLRFTAHDGYHHPLLQLFGNSAVLEVFLTRDGRFIFYTSLSLESEGEITHIKSVADLVQKFEQIQRETSTHFVKVMASVAHRQSPMISLGLRLDEMVARTIRDKEMNLESLRKVHQTMKTQSAVIGH